MNEKFYLPDTWDGVCWSFYHEERKFFKHEAVCIIIAADMTVTKTMLVSFHEFLHALIYTTIPFLNLKLMSRIHNIYDRIWINTVGKI